MSGLRLGASGMQGRYNMQGQLRYDVFVDGPGAGDPPVYSPYTIDMDVTFEIHHIAVLGAEYLRDRWSMVAEYYHEKLNGETAYGWYVQAGWQASQRLALATYYADTRPQRSDRIASQTPEYYGWQKDFTISLRYNLTDHWLFKLEKHYFDGVATAQPVVLADDPDQPMQKTWGMFVAKTTFHF